MGEYNDEEGATSCKKCDAGTVPIECYASRGHCKCRKCPKGKYGTDQGTCKYCDGPMDYNDKEGAKSCKKCALGTIPIRCYASSYHCGCAKCSKGKFGTESGMCKLCDGAMSYNDAEGAPSCKTCPSGTHPYRCIGNSGNCGCKKNAKRYV